MRNTINLSTRSFRQIMNNPTEFFCQACGRHTSHAAEKRKQASEQYTPPKYCSKRCKSSGKPSTEIVSGWKRLLDDASKGGKRTAVMCSEVQKEVFHERCGTKLRGDGIDAQGMSDNTTEDAQRLGMKRAKDREDTRRAARLLYHFGFQHFAAKPSSAEPDSSTVSPAKAAKSEPRSAQPIEDGSDPKLEAVQNGKVIQDVTHAKGEWGLRYRQD